MNMISIFMKIKIQSFIMMIIIDQLP